MACHVAGHVALPDNAGSSRQVKPCQLSGKVLALVLVLVLVLVLDLVRVRIRLLFLLALLARPPQHSIAIAAACSHPSTFTSSCFC